ncbi:hypothetical protein Mkiyose1665_12970 [Mycobacterium kiyosense]|uniref:Uncharacterized protein n=1 Tax=Mycobacterium kiyosense TaxID=2871094 RepID=A0A9P3Q7Z6_9MYCO|nr:hypothetical protein IWGMT90018_03030 [Mycobacterium kiyosense]BDE11708.1 hypothetical protein MKCMC460_05680 [Mycobacterium sp. 20KCMC460]GLB85025.1 hypothetical protein SRL2020028_42810 [Mycobacterium kiyosense]GLB88053.1 hypothetical protein SRL2020130_08700 [Mycobacterium kiyosense]GLB95389.1 hypothetical protein SRL2020226_21650 [Mycobacterium kiyosense]
MTGVDLDGMGFQHVICVASVLSDSRLADGSACAVNPAAVACLNTYLRRATQQRTDEFGRRAASILVTKSFASRAPQPDIARLKQRMGRTMPWYTITDGFDADFGVHECTAPFRSFTTGHVCSVFTS